MENNTETFEDELNSIIGICDEKITKYRAFIKEYGEIKGSAFILPNLNNTKGKVVSFINAIKSLKYRLYALMQKERT